MSDLQNAVEVYGSVKAFYDKLRISALPFVFIGLGVSQLVYGWIGDTILLRYVYPSVCIAIGLGLLGLVIYFLWLPGRQALSPSEERRSELLTRLATGKYGPFEVTPEFREDILYFQREGTILYKSEMREVPDRGQELCDYVTLAPAVQELIARGSIAN